MKQVSHGAQQVPKTERVLFQTSHFLNRRALLFSRLASARLSMSTDSDKQLITSMHLFLSRFLEKGASTKSKFHTAVALNSGDTRRSLGHLSRPDPGRPGHLSGLVASWSGLSS